MRSKHPNAPDSQLCDLLRELEQTRLALSLSYRQFDLVVDPELVESCIYEINAQRARYNYLIRTVKTYPNAAVAVGRLGGVKQWI